MPFFEITTDELQRLDAIQFSDVLLRLLKFEAENHGFRSSADILVPLKINVADAGSDGRIICDSTNGSPWIKNEYSIFQVKAYDAKPTKIYKEFFDDNKNIKKAIEEVLDGGGQYVFFISAGYTEKFLKPRLAKAKEAISHINTTFGKSYSEEQVRILEGNQIKDWVNEYINVVLRVKEYLGYPIPYGFKTIEQLVKYPHFNNPEFVRSEWFEENKKLFLDTLQEVKKTIRLVGHSGVGKTRMVYEILKSQNLLSKNAVYFDVAENSRENLKIIERLVNQSRTILIVDNCPLRVHNSLQNEIERDDSKFSLLTITSSVHESSRLNYSPDGPYLIQYVAKYNREVIESIIENFGIPQIDEKEIERIHILTDNNPEIAIRLLNYKKKGIIRSFRTIVDDEIILKLLFGNKELTESQIEKYTKAIKGLAIFSQFPSYETITNPNSVSEEYYKKIEFIASSICKVEKTELREICQFFIDQGIIERLEEFLTVVPTPLAIRLALEWWSILPYDEHEKFFHSLTENRLVDQIVNRLKYFDANDELKLYIETIFGESSPFGKAEVLNTELGSRLFRSLVEVNPEAMLKTLVKLYLDQPVDELSKVDIGRRNIVSGLELLCFNKMTFNPAAKILYRFAQAENESWSNNSQAIFKQLFRPFLSGTEADLNARLDVLKYAVSQSFVENNEFLIEAIMAAFEIQGASRMGGAERQGTRVLRDFRPATKLEVLEYWRQIIELLKVVWENYPEFRGQIEKQFYFNSLQINSIAEPDLVTNFIGWLESKDVSIPTSFYRSLERQLTFPRIPESAKIKIKEFLISKEPQSSKDKFIRLVRDASYSPGKDENGIDIDQTELRVRDLAREFWERGIEITELLDLMFRGPQMYTEIFIQEHLSLNKRNDQRMRLWDESVEKLKKIEAKERNWAVLNGVLQSSPENEKLTMILSLGEIDEFEEIFLSLVNLHLKSVRELETVWDLLIRKGYSSETISKLRMGHFVFEENFNSTKYICDKLISLGDIGYWSALDILYRRLVLKGISDNAEWDYCKRTYEEYNYFNLETKPKFVEFYDLVGISQKLVKKFTDTDFINLVTERLLNFLKTSHSLYYDDHFSELAIQLIGTNFDGFWRKFSEELLSSDYFVYSAKNLYGSDHGNTGSAKDGILFANEGKWGQIIEWCKENSKRGPIAIALLMPIYDHKGSDLHSFAKMMIDEFGSNSDFLVSMSTNMGSFGWVGSPIDYYEREKRLYEQLLERPNLQVKDYARKQIEIINKYIEREKLEDGERFLGL